MLGMSSTFDGTRSGRPGPPTPLLYADLNINSNVSNSKTRSRTRSYPSLNGVPIEDRVRVANPEFFTHARVHESITLSPPL
ncbi:hypothetical protein PGT21_030173 [Puccinia graminis f. sp. tritici]|uniref:Uncharacterized protein n=1 Tax=Puccinia graminis f. sp. tritici TaxID=56615 RepID=A0A5B0QC40_PUCGR|nr:hypothetical protein PGTUg99_025247 [Puccinia graminis f. sp. tritici]KAA1091222.1 hypothetical protein PGT21_029118 [Puccinia graminis f. sp. tritici]KAA1110711.1 hypothetical protein PGT21_030173 [Puccinia graminis f. sp. tritici]